jgi:hypothetical protein
MYNEDNKKRCVRTRERNSVMVNHGADHFNLGHSLPHHSQVMMEREARGREMKEAKREYRKENP